MCEILFNLRIYNRVSHAIQRAIVGHAKQHSVFLSGSKYTNHPPIHCRRSRRRYVFPFDFLSRGKRIVLLRDSPTRSVEYGARHKRRQEIRAGESLTWLQIIVLLCDCLLQQLKPLTQVGKLKLQWIRHNIFIVFCHCLFCRFMFLFFLVFAF